MKKLFLALCLCLATAVASFGQATVLFQNRATTFGIDAPVYDLVVGGTKLEGTGYWAQLFVATTNAPDTFFPVGAAVNFRTGIAAGYVDVGVDSSRSIPSVSFGDYVYTQVRAWTDYPSVIGYENVVKVAYDTGDLNVRFGMSAPVFMQTATSQLMPPPYMVGLQSFAITAVPEPEAKWLLVICAIGLIFLLRSDINKYPKK